MAKISIIISSMGSILVDFERKLERRQYISAALFDKVKKRAPEQILKQFSLDQYNDGVLESEYATLKDYFGDALLGADLGQSLTKEQAKAIMADEKSKLIVADSDMSKVVAMVAEVKYLIEKKRVAPSEILVVTKTEQEMIDLQEMISGVLGLAVDITSFQALGYRYIRRVLRYKNCYAVSENERDHIFLEYFKKRVMASYEKIGDFLECFSDDSTGHSGLIGNYFRKNYGRFTSFDDYLDNYVKDKMARVTNVESQLKRLINEGINDSSPRTALGERVRNKNEAAIANWLFRHSINYKYAQPFDDLLPADTNSIRPDFTINVGGRKIYVEYFDTKINGTNSASAKFREKKEAFHRKNHTNLIVLGYEPNCGYLKTLRRELEKFGLHLPRERNARETYAAIIRHQPLTEFRSIRNLFYETIDTIKTSASRERFDNKAEEYLYGVKNLDARVLAEKQYKYLRDFYGFYNAEIHRDADKLGFDEADMLYYAGVHIGRADGQFSHYKYIIVEEDSSGSARSYQLTRDLLLSSRANAIIVGNDWQTIYANAGLKMRNTYHFRDSLKGAKVFSFAEPSHNSCPLINVFGNYVLRDSDQIRHLLKGGELKNNDPFVFVSYEDSDELSQIKSVILSLHRQRPNDKILVLAGTNATIKKFFESCTCFQKEGAAKASVKQAPNCRFEITTVAKAKSTLADWVIVAGLADGQHSSQSKHTFWLAKLCSDNSDENMPLDEKRELVCAALMRARYRVILPRSLKLSRQDTLVNTLYGALR